jgi:lipoate synthase
MIEQIKNIFRDSLRKTQEKNPSLKSKITLSDIEGNSKDKEIKMEYFLGIILMGTITIESHYRLIKAETEYKAKVKLDEYAKEMADVIGYNIIDTIQ